MSLSALHLTNFKRFKNQAIDLSSPITLLLGPNSSGKSSIIKSILGLKQTIVSSNEHEVFATQGEFVDLGRYKDYVYRHDTFLPITISLVVDNLKRGFAPLGPRVSTAITYDLDNNTEQARISRIVIEDQDQKTLTLERKKTRNSYRLFANKSMAAEISKAFHHDNEQKFAKELENGISVTHRERLKFSITQMPRGGERSTQWLFRIFELLIDAYSTKLEKEIFYLGPLRSSPSRSYTRTSHNVAVGCKGEHTPSVLATLTKRQKKVTRGQSDLTVSHDALLEWLDIIFPGRVASTVTIEELVKLKISKAGSDSSADAIIDVGFGFSQVFPILVQAAVMPSGSTLIIEQPELHLHPMAQANLAKVIAKAVRIGRRFIIETHSEHFVRGLQLAVSEYKLSRGHMKGISPESLKVFYVPETPKNIQEMLINEWGEFTSDWPTGFFDEAYKLAFELLQNKAKHFSEPNKNTEKA